MVTLFIVKPIYNEKERNEKIKIGKNVFISILIIQVIKFAMSGFTLYDVLTGITLSIIGLVFYKIFVNSTVVLQDFWNKRAFTIEELIGASLILAIAVGAFGDFSIYGFCIKNILSILIVMVLGWKNGILVGTTSGVTIGVTLGVITGSEPIMIAAYAISGMMAGIFNRLGKVGVVVGFALGNVILAYVSNGYTVELIHFKEILIAFIGLLAVPNSLHIELEEFIGNAKFLPVTPDRALNKSKEVAENLNNVSKAIQEMATTYSPIEQTSYDSNKQIFIAELLNNLESYKDNMLYEDMADTEGKIVDEIFKFLLDKQEINRENLLEIFAKCNSYIVGFDDKDISQYLEENISQIVRTINVSYKVAKSDFIWKKRVEENQKNMEKQLNGVSKAIKKMAREIESEIDNETQYETQKTEIIELLKQKSITVLDISIRKDGRYILEVYLEELLETAKIEIIEKIATQVLGEKIVLNEESTVGKKLNFLSDDKYVMAIGTGEATKSKSELSGDAMLNVRLKDGKYLVAISDGMGTGTEARKSSAQSLRMLENLLLSGFDKNISLDLINTALINQNTEIFATLDIAIIDLYAGNIEFIKSGACPTYIKNNKKVQIIKSNSLPTGMVNSNNIQTFDKDITSEDIMLMCSDGILDANIEYKNKELWIKYMLEDIETTNTKKIADIILNEAIDNNFGTVKDDMSIIVCKFKEKERN
jgi:stage II sporulation protein E